MRSPKMSTVLSLVLLAIESTVVVSNGLVDDIDWSQLSLFFNESCIGSCADQWDDPPDAIASMPPPPLPPSLQLALAENHSFDNNDNCNLCHIFNDKLFGDGLFDLPKPEVKDSESWISVLGATIFGSVLFGALFLVFLFKWKKY